MHLPCLHAVVPKPAAAAGAAGWNLLPLGPPLQPGGGPFAFGLGPQTLPSAVQPGVNVYSEVPVPPASLLWDAITVGYGWVSDLLVYIGTPWIAAAVRRHAATRAQM